jgi:hypothetical protein
MIQPEGKSPGEQTQQRAQALMDFAERHFEPKTRHIGKDDYDLVVQAANDLAFYGHLQISLGQIVGIGMVELEPENYR